MESEERQIQDKETKAKQERKGGENSKKAAKSLIIINKKPNVSEEKNREKQSNGR